MKKILLTISLLVICVICINGKKKSFKTVLLSNFIEETQIMPECAADEIAMAWWIPEEFWKISMEQDSSISSDVKREMESIFGDMTIVCVYQAELTEYGSAYPFSKAKIQRGMTVNYIDANGTSKRMYPKSKIDPDLDYLLNTVLTGLLQEMAGAFGKNMHYYVFDNRDTTTSCKIDPYEKGVLSVNLTGVGGSRIKAEFVTPLDSLFIPRICPNGKEAHVTWEFCPWTGRVLD